MIQSITFGTTFNVVGQEVTLIGKNTYDDWKLVAMERPIFPPPALKSRYVDIPGGNGSLDLSDVLTGFPTYQDRNASWKFRVMNVGVPWQVRYSEIMEYLHGKSMKIILEDDPEYFYEGRVTVDSWESGPTWSILTINAVVQPYKHMLNTSLASWLWDPFNFDSGEIPNNAFEELIVNDTVNWTSFQYVSQLFGTVPISPVLIVNESTNLQAHFINEALNMDKTMVLVNGRNETPEFIFYGLPFYKIQFKGIGKISIEFRKGGL